MRKSTKQKLTKLPTEKRKNPVKRAIVTTIIVTLLIVASYALTFWFGVNYQRNHDKKVQIQASELVQSVSRVESKN
jgi:flagellar basal body-associated protein FliL